MFKQFYAMFYEPSTILIYTTPYPSIPVVLNLWGIPHWWGMAELLCGE